MVNDPGEVINEAIELIRTFPLRPVTAFWHHQEARVR
jgi:hypothetical protein